MNTRRIALALATVCSLGATQTADAAMGGMNSCREGYRAIANYNEIYVPGYVSDAQRGDILLTSGGQGVPREIFQALHKTYNHTMIVSQGDDGHGNTRFTHDTAISPGINSLDFLGSNGLVSWKPDHMRRMIPGNVIGDKASTLMHGHRLDCLSQKNAAGNPNAFADCMDARPLNLWKNANVLLRPAAPYLNQLDIVNAAEAVPQNSILYSFGAYSDHLGAYNAQGTEAAFGAGTMCSGFATEAINTALTANGYSSLNVNAINYTNAERFTAAIALHNRLYNELMSKFDPMINSKWYIRALVNIVSSVLNTNVPQIAKELSNQIVNCFAAGGACDNMADWTTVDPVAFQQNTPAPGPGAFYNPAQNTLGTGTSIAGDDILADALANGWATTINAYVMGDYYYNRFSHIDCCYVDPITGDVTGSCYRPELEATNAQSHYELTMEDGDGGSGGGMVPVSGKPGGEQAAAEELGEYLMGLEGKFVETKDSYCYVTDEGSVCTPLPEAEGEEEVAAEPVKETRTAQLEASELAR